MKLRLLGDRSVNQRDKLIRPKRFSFEDSFSGRMLLMRVQRHISQNHCEFDFTTQLFKPPAPDSPYWIVERILVAMESEFEAAKRRKKRAV